MADPECERRRRPGPGKPSEPCDQPAIYEAIVHCTRHGGTATRVLCARCVGHISLVSATCATCKTRTVVIAGILRLDGVDR